MNSDAEKPNIWFTADTHFGHKNIIRYCGRPYGSTEVHDHELIRNWNDLVQKDDTVYHLGDFAFGKPQDWARVIAQLNGNINLLKGNHDHTKTLNGLGSLPGKKLNLLGAYHELKVEDAEMDVEQVIVLCHYPIESWNKRQHGAWHLHGHCHGTLMPKDYQARIDVGVDCNNYHPVSYEDIKAVMTHKSFKCIDHHGEPIHA